MSGYEIADLVSKFSGEGREPQSVRRNWIRMTNGSQLNTAGEHVFKEVVLLPYWYDSRRDRSAISLINFYAERLSDTTKEIWSDIRPSELEKGHFPSIFLPEILIDLLEIMERYKHHQSHETPPSPLDMTALHLMLLWIDTQLEHYQSTLEPPTKGLLPRAQAQQEVPGDMTTQSVLTALATNDQAWMVLLAFVSSLARHLYFELMSRLTKQSAVSNSTTANFALLHGLIYGEVELVIIPHYLFQPSSDGYDDDDINRCNNIVSHVTNTIQISRHAAKLREIFSLYSMDDEIDNIKEWMEVSSVKNN